jgi:hypothetical protein
MKLDEPLVTQNATTLFQMKLLQESVITNEASMKNRW